MSTTAPGARHAHAPTDQRGLHLPPDIARARTAALLRRQPRVSCSGWRYHCLCPRHQGDGDGLPARYRKALQDGRATYAEQLAAEIEHLQTTLGRRS